MGDRILRWASALALCASAAVAHAGGRVTGKVTVTDPGGAKATADVIVYVVGFPEEGDTTKPTAQIAQKGRKFVPDLVAITVGESISFPNGDSFLHNVFSQSSTRKFDLGSFKKGESKDKAFPTPGVIDVYCNIHPEMAATILVLPNKRHVRAKPDGSFAIEGVPAGTWKVFAYSRRMTKPVSANVSVADGKDTQVELTLVRGAEPPHVNKFGEKYREPTTTYR